MSSLSVVQNVDKGFQWAFDLPLYDHYEFQQINNDLPQRLFYLVESKRKIIHGHLRLALTEGMAISHPSAPFGGLTFSDQATFEDQLFFVIEVVRLLRTMELNELILHQAPAGTDQLLELSARLEVLGFETLEERIYQMISLQHSFADLLHPMEKRKLKKSEEKGFTFDWAPADQLKNVLEFVEQQRSLLGYEFSMNWSQLRDYQKAFPGRYLGARVWHNGHLIAASILVKEREDVLYQFAPAHLRTYNRYSPVVYMTKCISEWAEEQQFQWLNLGTSYLDGVQNDSLFQFKENLGAETFIAASFQKSLNS